MKHSVLAWPLVVAGLVLSMAARGEEEKGSSDTIRGNWTIVRGENEGKEVPQEHIKGSRVVITDKQIVATDPKGKRVYVADYTLDTLKKPAVIAMKVAEGPDKGKSARGIVAREGRRLKLCYALPGGETPTEFSTRAKGHQHYFLLEPAVPGPKGKEESGR